MIRVSIVAASPLARLGLKELLADSDIEIVESVASLSVLGEDRALDGESDVIVADISGESVETSVASLANGAGDTPAILITDRAAPASIQPSLRAGIRALLSNDVKSDQLVAAVQAVAVGLLVSQPTNTAGRLQASTQGSASLTELQEPLTPREREVLYMLVSGLGNKQIADRLNISEHTIKFHVASILGKLNAGSRTEAVAIGIRRGLVLL
jgi:NarL family two-component system response regulator YdfI